MTEQELEEYFPYICGNIKSLKVLLEDIRDNNTDNQYRIETAFVLLINSIWFLKGEI